MFEMISEMHSNRAAIDERVTNLEQKLERLQNTVENLPNLIVACFQSAQLQLNNNNNGNPALMRQNNIQIDSEPSKPNPPDVATTSQPNKPLRLQIAAPIDLKNKLDIGPMKTSLLTSKTDPTARLRHQSSMPDSGKDPSDMLQYPTATKAVSTPELTIGVNLSHNGALAPR